MRGNLLLNILQKDLHLLTALGMIIDEGGIILIQMKDIITVTKDHTKIQSLKFLLSKFLVLMGIVIQM